MAYVGETKRSFGTQMREHLTGHLKTEVYLHEHKPKTENFKCVLRHRQTEMGEALVMKDLKDKNTQLMNNQLNLTSLDLFI